MTLTPFRLKMFMLFNLPLAFLAGLKLESLDHSVSKVSVRFGYLTKNPFKSIYFAVLCMAGELASGIMCLAAVKKSNVPVSMLVTEMEVKFMKKAVGKIVFTCNEGARIEEAVQLTVESKQASSVKTKSVGTDEQGVVVAEMDILWSFKAKA